MIERSYGVDCRNGDVNQDVNGTLQAKPGGVSLNTNIVALIPYPTKDLCAGQSGNCAGRSSQQITRTHLLSYTREAISFDLVQVTSKTNQSKGSVGVAYTLAKTGRPIVITKEGTRMDEAKYVVRRLTPMECERLQGYPDGWTKLEPIEDMDDADVNFWNAAIFEAEALAGRGEKFKRKTKEQLIAWYNKSFCNCDSKRYKAMGNSIALPQWRYILERMAAYLPSGATLGSLFDGVGGFPLAWEEIHGAGTAIWASEIELFPIAVTKYHFGEGAAGNEPGQDYPQSRGDSAQAAVCGEGLP